MASLLERLPLPLLGDIREFLGEEARNLNVLNKEMQRRTLSTAYVVSDSNKNNFGRIYNFTIPQLNALSSIDLKEDDREVLRRRIFSIILQDVKKLPNYWGCIAVKIYNWVVHCLSYFFPSLKPRSYFPVLDELYPNLLRKIPSLVITNEVCSKNILSYLLNKFPQLTGLEFVSCPDLSDKDIAFIVKNYPNLTSLKLDGCKQVSTKAMQCALTAFTRLTTLSLKNCHRLKREAFLAIAEHRNLEHLHLCEGGNEIEQAVFNRIITACTNLKTLSIENCPTLSAQNFEIIQQSIASRAVNYSQTLTALNISDRIQFSAPTFHTILEQCPNLTDISLYNLPNLPVEAFEDMAQYGKNLTTLDISNSCRTLESFRNNEPEFDAYLQAINTHLEIILENNKKTLKILKLRGFLRYSGTGLSSCTNLTTLDVSWCDSILPLHFQNALKNCPHLKVLNLEYCNNLLSDQSLFAIAKYSSQLEELSICEDSSLACPFSEESFIYLFTKCSNLKKLSIGNYQGLADRLLITISAHQKNLRVLTLSRCVFSDLGLLSLIKSCPRLKVLFLRFTPPVSVFSRQHIEKYRPVLRLIENK